MEERRMSSESNRRVSEDKDKPSRMSGMSKFKQSLKNAAFQHNLEFPSLTSVETRVSNKGSNHQKLKKETTASSRYQWPSSKEYCAAMISSVIGTGNIFRFPGLMHKHGGLAFLLVYVILFISVGVPLCLMFGTVGQTSQQTVAAYFKNQGMMYGLGFSHLTMSLFFTSLYQTYLSRFLYYASVMFVKDIPWDHCRREWLEENCYRRGHNKSIRDCSTNSTNFTEHFKCKCSANIREDFNTSHVCFSDFLTYEELVVRTSLHYCTDMILCTNNTYSPTYFFYKDHVKDPLKLVRDNKVSIWALSLFWAVFCIAAIVVNVKGKDFAARVAKYTVFLPGLVIVLIIIAACIYSSTGALLGVKYFHQFDYEKIKHISTWEAAIWQLIYSLNIGDGLLQTFSSYCKLQSNVYRNTLIFTCVDLFISVISSFAIFMTIGSIAYYQDLPINHMLSGDFDALYVIYPEILFHLPGYRVATITFFLMLSCFGGASSIWYFKNYFANFVENFSIIARYRIQFIVILCLIISGLGIILLLYVQFEAINRFEYVVYGCQLIVLLCEIGVIIWIHGPYSVIRDLTKILGHKPMFSYFLMFSWLYTCPVLLGIMLLKLIYQYSVLMSRTGYVHYHILTAIFSFSPLFYGILRYTYKNKIFFRTKKFD